MIKLKPLIISLLIPLTVGSLSGFLTMNSMEVYQNINQPTFSPPSYVFPVVWTLLYLLMGISAYLIYQSDSELKSKALLVYAVGLVVNFIWPLVFFNGQMYLGALILLIILWGLVLWMTVLFYQIEPVAGFLQIPYLLWLTFAAYLNFLIYILN